jgi:hypothetical protein
MSYLERTQTTQAKKHVGQQDGNQVAISAAYYFDNVTFRWNLSLRGALRQAQAKHRDEAISIDATWGIASLPSVARNDTM